MLILWFLAFVIQDKIPAKPNQEFEVTTRYELKRKPSSENTNPKFSFDDPDERQRESGTDMLPYLIINLKVKRWAADVEQVRVIDTNSKQYLKKKISESGLYTWDMGFVDDMKDKVVDGKFFVQFIAHKKTVEQITVHVDEEGTFFVNGEKRGKF